MFFSGAFLHRVGGTPT